MTLDDLSLDHATVAAQLEDASEAPSVQRCPWAWGASDVPTLWRAYTGDQRPARSYHVEGAKVCKLGVPKIIGEKLGLLKKKGSKATKQGTKMEPIALAKWAERQSWWLDVIPHGAPNWPLDSVVQDASCNRLTATLDAVATDAIGWPGVVEVKTTFRREELREPHWFWVTQVQAQLACTGYESGVIVVGDGWANPDAQLLRDPISFDVERDEEMIKRIRTVCVRAWEDVLKVRERMEKA